MHLLESVFVVTAIIFFCVATRM